MCRIRNSRALLRENSRLLVSTEEHAAGCALLSQHSNTTAADAGNRRPGGGGGLGGRAEADVRVAGWGWVRVKLSDQLTGKTPEKLAVSHSNRRKDAASTQKGRE